MKENQNGYAEKFERAEEKLRVNAGRLPGRRSIVVAGGSAVAQKGLQC